MENRKEIENKINELIQLAKESGETDTACVLLALNGSRIMGETPKLADLAQQFSIAAIERINFSGRNDN